MPQDIAFQVDGITRFQVDGVDIPIPNLYTPWGEVWIDYMIRTLILRYGYTAERASVSLARKVSEHISSNAAKRVVLQVIYHKKLVYSRIAEGS